MGVDDNYAAGATTAAALGGVSNKLVKRVERGTGRMAA
jgi:hypothetical protein